jgi:hypothetical protein
MSDRAYTRFTIPMSVLADPARSEAVRCIFGLTTTEFQRIILAQPETDEAAGYEGTTVRLVDGRPCLVYEDPNCNYGGTHTEQALIRAGVPFLQVNAAGDEYGSTATAWLTSDTETIRLDHDLAPVVGIGMVDGQITLDQLEIRDFEHYQQVRQAVLLWPAASIQAA